MFFPVFMNLTSEIMPHITGGLRLFIILLHVFTVVVFLDLFLNVQYYEASSVSDGLRFLLCKWFSLMKSTSHPEGRVFSCVRFTCKCLENPIWALKHHIQTAPLHLRCITGHMPCPLL